MFALLRGTVGLPLDKNEVEIRKGLMGGEDLILNPPDSLKENDLVKIAK